MNFDRSDLFLEPKVTQYANHMVMTNVNKPSKTKYYNIDTRFRDDYDEYAKISPLYYNITIPQRINEVKSIEVHNIEIPLTYYNISASLENNIFQVKYLSNNYIIVIPDGEYDSTSLTTAINNQFSLCNLSLNYSLQGSNSVFTSNNGSFTIQFAVKSSITTSSITTNDIFNKFNFKSSLGWILGFRNIEYSIQSTKSIKSEAFIDLNGPRYLYLVIDDYSQGNPNSFVAPNSNSLLNYNIIAKISMNSEYTKFGTIYTANLTNGFLLSDKRIYSGKVDLQRMKIQLVNETGLPLNLNGLDFSFALEIIYE